MGLTHAQKESIKVRDRTLLISAAAGSGKTMTLTKRVIKSIIEDEQDISRLLIVTFTKAAASQLKEKVSKAIFEAIENNQKNPNAEKRQRVLEHLQAQLIKLSSAHISTIDSFFMDPVRTNFEKLGLPASIRMADDAELLPIREKLMRDVLDGLFDEYRAYEGGKLTSAGYSDRLTQLIAVISESRDSSKLIPTLCSVYSKLLTSSDGVERLKSHAERFRLSADMPFFETLEGSYLKEHLCFVTDYAYKTMEALYNDACSDEAFSKKAIEILQLNANTCRDLNNHVKTDDVDRVIDQFKGYDFGSFPKKSCDPSESVEKTAQVRTSINKLLKDTRDNYLTKTADSLSRDYRLYAEITELLYEILSKFHEKYSSEKLNRGICDFADMPLFLMKLLRNEDGTYTEYANQLAKSFDAVYIDEYQDVNGIQNDIFTIIGRNHRFMVGDIKQSIYGFREAEPEIFRSYKNKFKEYTKSAPLPDDDSGNTIFMSENFRCDKTVIDFVNLICSSLFGTFSESIEYTSKDNLNLPLEPDPKKPYINRKVVINLVETPDCDNENDGGADEGSEDNGDDDNAKNLSDEAIVVANEIARLKREENVSFGDMKILARSLNHVKPLMSALSALKIKYSLSSKKELFETAEMKLLVALLESADNPHLDMSLCHLMTAEADDFKPFFSYKDVLVIKDNYSSTKNASLYDAVIAYSKLDGELAEKCVHFVDLINRMRINAGKMAADKVIKQLAFSLEFNGLAQTTAYTFLYDCVCKYVKSNWNSLHSFLEYYKKLISSSNVGGEPDSPPEDAVTVMTIHHSKGLEAKACFLFGFGKKFNLSNKYNLLYDRDFGPSMKLPPEFSEDCSSFDKIKIKHEDNTIRKTFSLHSRDKQVEEEARVLYVALTRAQERLYISATLPKSFETYYDDLKNCVDVNYKTKKSNKYIDWIMLALPTVSENDLYDVNVYAKGQTRLTSPFTAARTLRSDDLVTDKEKKLAELYISPTNQSAEETLLSMIPSKIAASKAAPDMLDKSVFVSIPETQYTATGDEAVGEAGCDSEKMIRERIKLMRSRKTDFDSLLKAGEKPTAAEKGTAAHQFLQFCDYGRVERDGVECEIEFLYDNKFIGKRTKEILKKDANKLKAFFDSDFFAEVRKSKPERREFHFRIFRPSSDFTTDADVKSRVADKFILVQGSIDLIVETQDGKLILCDYKTDRITAEQLADRERLRADMKERHGSQLDQYKYACRQIFGKTPDKIVLFLLSIGECIEV